MKFNFRKIASILTSTVMLSSTVAMAAAATFPAPFIQSGKSAVNIVVGASADVRDGTAAANIQGFLESELAKQLGDTGSSTTTTTTVNGESFQLARGANNFNLGDNANEFYSTLDADQLPNVLASGTYSDANSDEYDYEQSLALGGMQLTHFLNSDFNDNKPIVGFDIASGENIMNYTLEFLDPIDGGADFANLEDTDLTILGKTYYVQTVTNSSDTPKLTLLDSANSAMVGLGETQSIEAGGKSYSVEVVSISSDDSHKVRLKVDGALVDKQFTTTTKPYEVSPSVWIAVKSVDYSTRESVNPSAEISVGTGQIILEDGQEVQVNGKDVSSMDQYGDSSLVALIDNTGKTVNSITLEWTVGQESFVSENASLTMPAFENVKFSMGALHAPGEEETVLQSISDSSIKVSTTVEGGAVDIPLLYLNDASTAIEGLGEKSTHVLVTNSSSSTSAATAVTLPLDKSDHSYFAATWISSSGAGDEGETHMLELRTIERADGNNETTLKDMATDSDFVLSEVGKDRDLGQVTVKLLAANYGAGTATIQIYPATSGGTVYANRVVTKDGLVFRLPVSAGNTAGDGNINVTATSTATTWRMNFTEKDVDGNIQKGDSFSDVLTVSSGDGIEPVDTTGITTYETEDNSDYKVGYKTSDLATKALLYNPSGSLNKLTLTAHSPEVSADVFVSEAGATVTTGGGGTGTKRLGSIVVQDTEAASVANQNVIVVGGSCINSVAANLLGGASCTSAFTTKTGVGAGQFLIQTFDRGNGKIATLVAGYNADDTLNAAQALTTQTIQTDVGKKYTGSSAADLKLS